jgi:hypothetical protein
LLADGAACAQNANGAALDFQAPALSLASLGILNFDRKKHGTKNAS